MKTELRHLVHDPDRAGNHRYYVRLKVGGRYRKKRLRQPFRNGKGEITQAFMAEYWAALAELRGDAVAAPKDAPPPRQETFNWLFDQYFRSTAFKRMDPATQADKRSVLNRFAEAAGALPYKKYRKEDMERSQLARRATPGAADKLVKVLKAVFNWAMKQTPPLASFNPAVGVEPINRKKGGFHTWTTEELQIFRAHWPVGSVARLALELMISIGARRSDSCQIGPRHMFKRKGRAWVRFTAHKGRNLYPVEIEARLTDEAVGAIEAVGASGAAFITTSRGTPYTIESFGNAFSAWCTEAGLPHCSAHGLRKAAAIALAESGSTAIELCAIFGWTNLRTAQIYIEKANKTRLRENAFTRLDNSTTVENVSKSGVAALAETNEGN